MKNLTTSQAGGYALMFEKSFRGRTKHSTSFAAAHTMLSFVASASLSLNIGSSALTSARAAPSMVAAMETSFVYSPPAPLGTTSGEQYPNTVRRLLSSANTTLEACRTRQAHHQHVDFRA